MASQKQSVHTIADCFIMNKEKFLVYGEYCSNLLQAQDLLDHVCNTNQRVQKLVGVCLACCMVNFVFSRCLDPPNMTLQLIVSYTLTGRRFGKLLKFDLMSYYKGKFGTDQTLIQLQNYYCYCYRYYTTTV